MDEDTPQPEAEPSKRKRHLLDDNAEAGQSNPSRSPPIDQVPNWYILSLDSHIASVKKNLLGPHVRALGRGAPNARAPTIIPPINAEFTPEARAKFFLALSRHSRFRPDLIARDIGKELIEVEYYLDLLEDGYASVQRNKGLQEGQRSRIGRYKKRYKWEEGLSAAAREVSEEWIAEEEQMAGRVKGMAEAKEETNRVKQQQDTRAAKRKATVKPFRTPPLVVAKKVGEANAVKELEKRWQLEDWMEDLSVPKMETLGKLLEPAWQQWADPIACIDAKPVNGALQPSKQVRHIVQQNQTIKEIEAIRKKKRTPEQRATLRKLLNMKYARQVHRVERLIQSGMTKEEIEAQGGADEVYWKRDEEMRANGGDRWKGPNDEGKAARQKMKKGAEDVGAVNEFVKRGWDVFDLTKVTKWHQCFVEKTGSSNLGDPTITISTLALLHSHLVAYLAPLILQSILTAEQAFSTSPELEPDPEISLQHVQSALAMRNEDPIGDLLAFRKRWVPDHTRLKRAETFGHSFEKSTTLDDYALPFRDIAVLSTGPEPTVGVEDKGKPEQDSDDDSEGDWDDISSTVSDQEDEKLDDALDAMDTAHDELYEHRLWEGRKAGAQVEDWNDPWDETKLPQGASVDSSELLASAEASRDDYIAALDDINKSRRWRRSIQLRSTRMPTLRLKSQAMKYRLHKSAAEVILDSDEEYEE